MKLLKSLKHAAAFAVVVETTASNFWFRNFSSAETAIYASLTMNFAERCIALPYHHGRHWKLLTPFGLKHLALAQTEIRTNRELLYGTLSIPRTCRVPRITCHCTYMMIFCIVSRVRSYRAEKLCWEVYCAPMPPRKALKASDSFGMEAFGSGTNKDSHE